MKVTLDLMKFFQLSGAEKRPVFFYMNGLYANGIIWSRRRSFISIAHEVEHGILKKPYEWNMNASVILMFDFFNDVLDFINGILRYKAWRKNVHDCLGDVKLTWSDWLDWILCRDPGE
jgi:hypothetical protein